MKRTVLVVALLLLNTLLGYSQDSLIAVRITEIDISRFPAVELNLRIQKPGNNSVNVSAANAHLTENGIPQLVEYFDCPQDSSTRLSIAILLDRSSSMQRFPNNDPDPDSTKIRAAKAAISTFVDLLGVRDEAAIFSFTTDNFIFRHIFRVEQDFTTDRDALKGALVPIVATGSTRLWEAIIDAVDLLRVREGRKVLIVVTDGKNRFGSSNRSTAFQRAVDEGIPVYPIGIGEDIDEDELSSLASTTGGSFYPAPDIDDLEEIFAQLGSELITDDCVLRYTSSNTCLDGSRRDIELALSGIGYLGEADTFYVLPRKLNPVTLSVESGVNVTSRETAIVPLTVLEQFSTSQPLSYTTTVSYDASMMRFQAVRTDGSMSEGAQVSVVETPAGTLRIELLNFLPAYPSGTLFELQFETYASSSDTSTSVEIVEAEITGLCPMELTAINNSVRIEACREEFTLYGGAIEPVASGEEFILPIRITPRPSTEGFSNIRFSLRYPSTTFTYLGIETAGTVAAQADVLVQQGPDSLDASIAPLTEIDTDTLIFLRFRAPVERSVQHLTLDLILSDLISGCTVQLESIPPEITVDGVCQPLIRRTGSQADLWNFPNPFSDITTLSYTLPEGGSVELYLLDRTGRKVKTLLNASLRQGSYQHVVALQDLPAGEYLTVLRVGDEVVTRRILHLK